MKNSWLIALREFKQRLGSRSFILMSVLGPLFVLALLFALFKNGSEGRKHWNVLIVDPTGLMENKIMLAEEKNISYFFTDQYLEMEEFRVAKQFAGFDALIEINEKVLSNKTIFIFHRNKPSVQMQIMLQFQIERRLEEVMVEHFTKLTLQQFRSIKQPMNVTFRDVNDPYNKSSDIRGWVGFFFGAVIILFILFFGMTILRSVMYDKSNRIVEVMLASVKPSELMLGKIIGIGLLALIQFVCWILFIAIGLFAMRELLFPNMFDASISEITQMTKEMSNQNNSNLFFNTVDYNQLVDLVFERIQFGNMLIFFLLFLIFGYLFYASFFVTIGATAGSESDGQQFIIPMVLLLTLACYSGYYSVYFPESAFVEFLHFLPFTSPIVVLVKLAYGYEVGHAYELYVSLLILIISSILMLILAGRLYKNGILHVGHRISLVKLFRWMKKT